MKKKEGYYSPNIRKSKAKKDRSLENYDIRNVEEVYDNDLAMTASAA